MSSQWICSDTIGHFNVGGQEYVYCDLEYKWFSNNGGSISKHAGNSQHKNLTADIKAHPAGWMEYQSRPYRRWRWEGDGRSKVLGAADDSMLDCTLGVPSGDMPSLNDGQRRMEEFTFPPLKSVERRQPIINAQAASIVLDNRPLSAVQRKGFRILASALRPNYVVASLATTARTIIAQRNFLAERLRQVIQKSCSSETSSTRKFNLPPGLHVPYVKSPSAILHHRAGFASWQADLWTSR